MEEIIIELVNEFGYLGILFLVAVENVFPPIPSEIILTFGGFLTTYTSMNVIGVIIASTIGAILGAFILYFIGFLLNKDRLIKIVSGKIGKILRLKKEDIEKADEWFSKKGQKTVFLCRFVPIVRSLISIPAGMNKMNFSKFTLYTFLGTVIWNTVLVTLGSIVGDNWEKVANIFDKYSSITLVVLVILFIVFVVWFYKKRSKENITS